MINYHCPFKSPSQHFTEMISPSFSKHFHLHPRLCTLLIFLLPRNSHFSVSGSSFCLRLLGIARPCGSDLLPFTCTHSLGDLNHFQALNTICMLMTLKCSSLTYTSSQTSAYSASPLGCYRPFERHRSLKRDHVLTTL